MLNHPGQSFNNSSIYFEASPTKILTKEFTGNIYLIQEQARGCCEQYVQQH